MPLYNDTCKSCSRGMPRSEACQETLAEIRTAPLSIALCEATRGIFSASSDDRSALPIYEGGLVASPTVDFRRGSGWKGSGRRDSNPLNIVLGCITPC